MAPAASRSSSDMPRYSSSDTIYPEDAPYQPSRSALRRRFGNRAIVSRGPEQYIPGGRDRPGDASVRDPRTGLTDEATWRDFFTPSTATMGGAPAAAPVRPMSSPPSNVATFYNEQNPFGATKPGIVTSGTNFVSRFGRGSVRSGADMRAGRNAPQDLSAWDAFLKSPAPAAPPPTSMNLLPSPRQGTPIVPQRTSDFSPTPTADDYYGAILSKPSKLSITTGVLDRLAGPSPWEEPI